MEEWQKTVPEISELEHCILSVDESYRITLPKGFCKRVGWITGEKPHSGWLLIASPRRCRLFSEAEGANEPDFKMLRDKITAELNAPSIGLFEFQNEVLAALPLRLTMVEIMPRGTGWRLTLPKSVAAIMQIRAKESDIAVLLLHGHIELWTIETLRSSVTTPLSEII